MSHKVDVTIRIPPAWHRILKRRRLWDLDAIRHTLLDALPAEQGLLPALQPLSDASKMLNSIAAQLEFAHKRLDLDFSSSRYDQDLNEYLEYSRNLVQNGLRNATKWMDSQLGVVALLVGVEVDAVLNARESANRVVARMFAARPGSFYKMEPCWATALLALYCHIVDQPFSPLLQTVLTRAHESGLLPTQPKVVPRASSSALVSNGPKRKMQMDAQPFANIQQILSCTGWSENRLVLETLLSRLENQPPAHRLAYDCHYQAVLAVDNVYHAAMACETIAKYKLLQPLPNAHGAFLRQVVKEASSAVKQSEQQLQFLAASGYKHDSAFRKSLSGLQEASKTDNAALTAPVRNYLRMLHIN